MDKRLIDLTVLIAYSFEGDPNHKNAESFFQKVESEGMQVSIMSTMPMEAEAIWMARKIDVDLRSWLQFIEDVLENPLLQKIPLTPELFAEHTKQYRLFGGKYTYFDSFHVAAARILKQKLVTTDKQILGDADIPSEDLKNYAQ
ncbi:MAG: PIN domain-containing protein [Candidatus Jordarchaeaceae archaeon]